MSEGVKRCKRCEEVKPLDAFARDRNRADGLNYWCKACTNGHVNALREARRAEARARVPEKSPEEREREEREREQRRRQRATEYARQRAARMSPEAREQRREYKRQWEASNRERLTASRRQRWAINPPQRPPAVGYFTNLQWLALLDQCGHRCLACGVHADDTPEGKLTADHVVPLSQGGTNWITNLQPLCKSCTSRKGARAIDYRPAAHEEESQE